MHARAGQKGETVASARATASFYSAPHSLGSDAARSVANGGQIDAKPPREPRLAVLLPAALRANLKF